MSARCMLSVLSSSLVVATVTVAGAQPKGAPPAPAKDAPAAAPDAGAPVAPVEEPPPSDMDGINENPDAPKTIGGDTDTSVTTKAPEPPRVGYPIEEVHRPITLPANMSEVSIAPHIQVSPYMGSDALRARYGITRQVQLGLTYAFGGSYDDPTTMEEKIGFHPGKAVGVDVTVLLQSWIGVKVGVPIYVDPLAVGITVGAPLKFQLGDKVAIGGLDDLLTFAVEKFAPSMYQEAINAQASAAYNINTTQSRGNLRFSFFGVYQQSPKLAIVGRGAVHMDDFEANRSTTGYGGVTTSLRGGIQYSPRKYLDLGISLGFDDLAHGGSFAPQGLLALRI